MCVEGRGCMKIAVGARSKAEHWRCIWLLMQLDIEYDLRWFVSRAAPCLQPVGATPFCGLPKSHGGPGAHMVQVLLHGSRSITCCCCLYRVNGVHQYHIKNPKGRGIIHLVLVHSARRAPADTASVTPLLSALLSALLPALLSAAKAWRLEARTWL